MPLEELDDVLGEQPLTGASFPADMMPEQEKVEFYLYERGALVGTVNGRLAFVACQNQ